MIPAFSKSQKSGQNWNTNLAARNWNINLAERNWNINLAARNWNIYLAARNRSINLAARNWNTNLAASFCRIMDHKFEGGGGNNSLEKRLEREKTNLRDTRFFMKNREKIIQF